MSKREVDQYIALQSEPQKTLLKTTRKMILEIEPALKQGISYGLPAFILDGDVVCGIAARKNGCSYYPFSGSVLAATMICLTQVRRLVNNLINQLKKRFMAGT